MKLTGRRYRCPDCESWKLKNAPRTDHVRCEHCNARHQRHELLDAEEDELDEEKEQQRRSTVPTTGMAAKLAAIGEQRSGGDA